MLATTSPFPQYFDSNGQPLDAGYIYFGLTGQNPETSPVTMYWDSAGTQPIAQPVRTMNGFVVRSGTPAPIFSTGDYSITVKDSSERLLFYIQNSSEFSNYSVVLAVANQVRTDLANNADAAKGSGMVAFGPGVSYGTGTVGGRINKAGHPTETNVILGFGIADDHGLAGTVGYRSTIVGVGAGAAIGTAPSAGGSNCYYGFGSGAGNTSGSGNCFYGALTATLNTTGDHNNIFGYRSLDKHTNSLQNNAFGFENLFSLTTGNNNCSFGESTLFSATNTTGSTAFGAFALYSKTTGDYSTAFGYQAGFYESTGTLNTYVGYQAGYHAYTATGNTMVGHSAGNGPVLGSYNTVVGQAALSSTNAVVGTNGQFNSAFGWSSLLRLTTASGNTAVGQQAGSFVTTGDENIFVGASAGVGITTGTHNVVVGVGATSAANRNNTITIGFNAQPNGDNQVTLGDTNINAIRAQVTTITALSDRRDKADIEPLTLGIDFIRSLRPVSFTWQTREGSLRDGHREAGFIAQELKDAQEVAGAEWLGLVLENNPDRLEATPGKLLPILVSALQELAAQNAALSARVAALESQ